ncbi:hypothetical protein V6N13_121886 [Hibiscus sabdariffa]
MKIDIDYAIVIDAPSLVYFKYIGHVGRGYTLRNIESLEKVDITIFHLKDVDRDRSAALLRGICNVRVLHLSINNYDAQLFRGPLNSVPAFYNLVELEFKNHCNDCKLFPEEVISCLLYHLKEISIFCFRGDTHTFEMVSYFLNHASVLEKLVMRSIDVPHECRSSVIEKLSSLPKISKKCEIEIC